MQVSRRAVLRLLAGTAAAAGLPGCATTNPATGRATFTGFQSLEDDIRIGREQHPKMVAAFGGAYEDGRLSPYVTQIGRKVAAHTGIRELPYTFTVLNSPIVNAFALPGGFVYVSRGLLALASNEAELAGVLAHEVSHVVARHSAERLGRVQLARIGLLLGAIGARALGLPAQSLARLGETIATLAIQSYSRAQELEADRLGARYMSQAGYDPGAMVTFLASLREEAALEARALGLPAGSVDQFNMLSTHPRTIDRVEEAMKAAAELRPPRPLVRREAYLRRLDGMLFGDDPRQGLVLDRRFVHPGLRFEFRLPPGFRVRNEPEAVIARDRFGAGILFDIAPVQGARTLAEYLRRKWVPEAPLQDVESFRAHGLPGVTAWAPARTDQGPARVRLAVIGRDARSVYRFLMVAPGARARSYEGAFRDVLASFRSLTETEAAAVHALRLLVVPAQPGDRVEALARTLPWGELNPDWFRVLNDLPPGGQPVPGQLLKVVAA